MSTVMAAFLLPKIMSDNTTNEEPKEQSDVTADADAASGNGCQINVRDLVIAITKDPEALAELSKALGRNMMQRADIRGRQL